MLKHGDPNNMFGYMDEDYQLLSILTTPLEEFKKHKIFTHVDYAHDFTDDDIYGTIYGIIEEDQKQYDDLIWAAHRTQREYLVDENRVKIDTPINFLRSILIEDTEEEDDEKNESLNHEG